MEPQVVDLAAFYCRLAFHPVFVAGALLQSTFTRKPVETLDAVHPGWAVAGAAFTALLCTLPAAEIASAYWIFCCCIGLSFLLAMDFTYQCADAAMLRYRARCTILVCNNNAMITTTGFDARNPWDVAALLSCALDPLFLAAAGASPFGYARGLNMVAPYPVAPFEFAEDASNGVLLQVQHDSMRWVAVAVVALHAVAFIAARLCPAPSAAGNAAAVFGGALLIPCIVHLARAALSDFQFFYAIVMYLPAAVFMGGHAVRGNVYYSRWFIAIERGFKATVACACVAMAATGHDIAQAAMAVFANACLGAMLLTSQKCTSRGVARTRALGHGLSIVAVAVSIAVRYGAPDARMFGWGALICLGAVYTVACCCAMHRKEEDDDDDGSLRRMSAL